MASAAKLPGGVLCVAFLLFFLIMGLCFSLVRQHYQLVFMKGAP
jgi:hypothetical protein